MGQVFDMTPALVNGLRRDSRAPVNTLACETYRGLKATEFGAKSFPTLAEFDITSEPTASWPFPQLFKGKGVTLLCEETTIHLVDTSVDPWTLSAITTYDVNTPASTKSITAGGTWHFVDFHSTWFLFNDNCQVFQTGWQDSSKVFVQDTITIQCGCEFRGRMITGGFDTSDFWTSAWQTLWTTLVAEGFSTYGLSLSAPGSNWVGWSNIGGGDLMNLFLSSVATADAEGVSGGYSDAVPRFLDQLQRLESGFMPMDFQGNIWRVKPLRDHVVVYGDQGISVITPYSQPVPTFGLVESIHKMGLRDKGLVGGTLDEHLFVDAEGVCYKINNQLQVERLGYEEFFATWGALSTDPLISWDPDQREYLLSASSSQYALTPTGLSQSIARVESVAVNQDRVLGYHSLATSSADLTIEFLPTDFGSRNVKTVQEVQVSCVNTGANKLKVGFKFRYRKSESFSDEGTFDLDEDGRYRIMLSGVEFQFRLFCAVPGDVSHIDNFYVILSDGTKSRVDRRFP